MSARLQTKITDRIDRITGVSETYRHEILPAPKSVKIELTARCDLACFFCATPQNLREKQDMDFSFYKRIVKEMREAGVEEIGVFYLGESMLYPMLPEAISYTKKIGIPYVFLTTNGRLASPWRLEPCIRAGLDSLKFSFNSADKQQFKDITRVDAFDDVVEHIKQARETRDQVEKETGHRCGLFASSILYDGDQRRRMQKAIDMILPYVDEHYFLPLYGQAGLTVGEKGKEVVPGNIGRIGAIRPPLPCWSILTEGHVTYDGKLAACCFDHYGAFDMADLNKVDFMTGWNSKKFQELRHAHLTKKIKGTPCEDCIAVRKDTKPKSR